MYCKLSDTAAIAVAKPNLKQMGLSILGERYFCL